MKKACDGCGATMQGERNPEHTVAYFCGQCLPFDAVIKYGEPLLVKPAAPNTEPNQVVDEGTDGSTK